MKTNPDPERDAALLDALLDDEHWQAANAAFKSRALHTLDTRRRMRRLCQWSGGGAVVVAAAVLLAAVAHRPPPSAVAPRQMATTTQPSPKPALSPRQLTDAELIAAFPKGSCFIAEVDGKKQLVFFDPRVERACVARVNP